MKNCLYKRSNGKNAFTDFKHHAKSWANSKRMRSRRTRQALKAKIDIIFCKDCKYFIDDENDINFGEAVKYWHEFDCSGLCIFDVVDRCGQYRVTDVKDFCSNGEPTQN